MMRLNLINIKQKYYKEAEDCFLLLLNSCHYHINQNGRSIIWSPQKHNISEYYFGFKLSGFTYDYRVENIFKEEFDMDTSEINKFVTMMFVKHRDYDDLLLELKNL